MRNVQQRVIRGPLPEVTGLLATLGTPGDALWPSSSWPPMILDDGLRPGSKGGHGPIRYAVARVETSLVRFDFDQRIGIRGHHTFTATPIDAEHTMLTHTLEGRLHGRMVLLWPVAVRWLHDALLRDLLDNAERTVTGAVTHPNRWSPWVRLIRRVVS